MARPIYTQKITRSTDWGGDASTGNAPVSGARVQEYIKEEFVTLEENHNELSGKHDSLLSNVRQLEALQGAQASQIAGIQQVVTAQGSAIASLQEEDATHAAQIAGIQQAIGSHAQDIASLQATEASHGNAISGLQADMTQAKADIEQLEAGKADKSSFVVLSETAYDALPAKDNDVFYYIYED